MTTSPASGALPADTRAQFERWWSDEGRFPHAIKCSYGNFYALRETQEAWFAWRACAAALASREASPAALTVMEERNVALKAFGYPDRFSNEPGEWEKFYAGWKARAALASPQVAPALELDPLQGAADWIKAGLTPCSASDIAGRLLIGYNRALRLFNGAAPAPVAPTPAATVTMPCEDCGGCGEVGEAAYQGAFQPPERDRCESCQGSGQWEVAPIPAQPSLDDDERSHLGETLAELESDGQTTTDYETLIDWAGRGFLRCKYFEITPEGWAATLPSEPEGETP